MSYLLKRNLNYTKRWLMKVKSVNSLLQVPSPLDFFGGGQQANAMNYDYMKKNPNSAIQLSEIDGQWFQEAAIRFVELGDSLLNTKNKVQQKTHKNGNGKNIYDG